MADEPFSNREIRAYFDNFEKTLLRIEGNSEKRIKEVEDKVAGVLLWREGLMGRVAAVTSMATILVGIGVAAINKKFF